MNNVNKNTINIKFGVKNKQYKQQKFQHKKQKNTKEKEESKIDSSHRQASPNLLRYSSLIPTTLIKTHSQQESKKKIISTSVIVTNKFGYSKFPCRRPKTRWLSTTTFIPVNKDKISTDSWHSRSRSKQLDFEKPKTRMTSCFDLKYHQDEKIDFVRYSQHQLKTEYIQRRKYTIGKSESIKSVNPSP